MVNGCPEDIDNISGAVNLAVAATEEEWQWSVTNKWTVATTSHLLGYQTAASRKLSALSAGKGIQCYLHI